MVGDDIMRIIRIAAALLVALGGHSMPAQPTEPGPGNVLLVQMNVLPPEMLYLKDNELRRGGYGSPYYESLEMNRAFVRYVFDGREYRKLSAPEVAQYDAMPNVEVRRGRLYYGGKRIRTNSLWVFRSKAAYHWNGGVALVANTSKRRMSPLGIFLGCENETGFIDLATGRCRFRADVYKESGQLEPSILVPVTVDMDNKDLALDVAAPEKVYLNEVFDLAFTLTNRSGRTVSLPDTLAEGLGIVGGGSRLGLTEYATVLDWNWRGSFLNRSDPDPVKDFHWVRNYYTPFPYKSPEQDASRPLSDPLGPGESRGGAVTIGDGDKRLFFKLGPRWRVVCYWDGFLDPGDRGRMSRFLCERWVDVLEPAIDTSRKDLAMEVAVPERVPWSGKFDVRLSLANVSDRPVLVPDNIADGLGVVHVSYLQRARPGEDVWGRKRKPWHKNFHGEVEEQKHPTKHPKLRIPYRDHCSPLLPGERREAVVSLRSGSVFSGPSCLEFYWDGLLDPDDRGHVSRFSTGKTVWVDVTK